jgi:CelD/BcsL family acetyltransferase involved in cellulose biosynthesis
MSAISWAAGRGWASMPPFRRRNWADLQAGIEAPGGGRGVTSIDAAPGRWLAPPTRGLNVELFAGNDLTAAGWPSIMAGPELQMYVYQSREFLEAWMATIGQARGAQCFLVVVTDRDKRPVLYLPLAIETKFNIRILRFMDGGVADFNAPILVAGYEFTQNDFMEVWAEILSLLPTIDVIDLQKISGDVSTVRNPLTYLECDSYRSSGHTIHLDCLHTDSHKERSIARMRKKLRRQYQRLSESGTAEFLVNPSGTRLDQVMDILFDLKRKQYLRTSGRDFFAMPGVHDFYREMAAPGRLDRISHLSALTCGSEVVSAHLGFIGRGRFYYVLPAFDTRYRSLAVGHVLLDHLIESSKKDYAAFDLGEGDFSYKEKWTTHLVPLWSCEQAVSTPGFVYCQLRRIRRFVGNDLFNDFYAKVPVA